MQVRRNPHTEVPQFDHIKALSGRRQWPGGDLFYTVKGSGVSFMFFMWISIIILSFFFFDTRMPRTDRDGCRAAETEAGGNEYFFDVQFMTTKEEEWDGRKKLLSFRWVLSICQFAKYQTFPSCGVFFLSVPCLTQPPGLVELFHSFPLWFCVVEKPGSWRALKPPRAYFLFTVSKFLSSHRHIYFLCPCFCGRLPVCGGPF